jgi:hypothetical protein
MQKRAREQKEIRGRKKIESAKHERKKRKFPLFPPSMEPHWKQEVGAGAFFVLVSAKRKKSAKARRKKSEKKARIRVFSCLPHGQPGFRAQRRSV